IRETRLTPPYPADIASAATNRRSNCSSSNGERASNRCLIPASASAMRPASICVASACESPHVTLTATGADLIHLFADRPLGWKVQLCASSSAKWLFFLYSHIFRGLLRGKTFARVPSL